jgi:hypothetical protein
MPTSTGFLLHFCVRSTILNATTNDVPHFQTRSLHNQRYTDENNIQWRFISAALYFYIPSFHALTTWRIPFMLTILNDTWSRPFEETDTICIQLVSHRGQSVTPSGRQIGIIVPCIARMLENTKTLCGKNVEFFCVQPVGTYTNQQALTGYTGLESSGVPRIFFQGGFRQEFFFWGGGVFNKFSWGQRAERTEIWGR